jgi:hypothetical protein
MEWWVRISLSFAGGDFSVDEEPPQPLGLVITPAGWHICRVAQPPASVCSAAWFFAHASAIVAQTSSLLYRRLPAGGTFESPERRGGMASSAAPVVRSIMNYTTTPTHQFKIPRLHHPNAPIPPSIRYSNNP